MKIGRTKRKEQERKDEQACIRKLNNRKTQKKKNGIKCIRKSSETAIAIRHGTALIYK